eukprot:g15224.t1
MDMRPPPPPPGVSLAQQAQQLQSAKFGGAFPAPKLPINMGAQGPGGSWPNMQGGIQGGMTQPGMSNGLQPSVGMKGGAGGMRPNWTSMPQYGQNLPPGQTQGGAQSFPQQYGVRGGNSTLQRSRLWPDEIRWSVDTGRLRGTCCLGLPIPFASWPFRSVMLGFPGCGTTSASKVLASHPNLSMVSRDPKGHRWNRHEMQALNSLIWRELRFARHLYMSDPTILLNLDKAVSITYIRKAKFVVMVRDPAHWLASRVCRVACTQERKHLGLCLDEVTRAPLDRWIDQCNVPNYLQTWEPCTDFPHRCSMGSLAYPAETAISVAQRLRPHHRILTGSRGSHRRHQVQGHLCKSLEELWRLLCRPLPCWAQPGALAPAALALALRVRSCQQE